MDMIDHRQDILSDILGFCGGSYLLSGRVSRGWNDVYKMRNKVMTTCFQHCTTIDSMFEMMDDDTLDRSIPIMKKLLSITNTFESSSDDSARKIVKIKSYFVGLFRWDSQALVDFAKECTDVQTLGQIDDGFIMDTMEEIILEANSKHPKSTMFFILDMYYERFPHRRGCDVFTYRIAHVRFFELLREYVDKYENGRFNLKIISSTGNTDIRDEVWDHVYTRRSQVVVYERAY